MSKRTLEEAVEEYKTHPKLTQKIRAELENEIGQYRPEESRDRHSWVEECIGEPRHNVDRRARIFALGTAADMVWEHVDGPMPLSTAVKLSKAARDAAFTLKISIEKATQMALEEYMGYEAKKFLGDGKVLRVPSPAQRKRMKRTRVTVAPKLLEEEEELEDAPVSEVPPSTPLLTSGSDEASFWRDLRALVSGYIDQRMVSFDGMEKAAIKKDIEAELAVVLESLRVKIHLRQSRRRSRISWSDMEQACSSLAMDPPSRGGLPDLELARKNKRKLAKEYHTDTGGTEANKGQLTVVVQAYNVLEEYTKQMQYSETQGSKRVSQPKGKSRGDSHE